MTFPQFTRKKRLEADITLQQVADILTLPNKSNVQRRESGEVPWRLWEVERLAELLGYKLADFIKEYDE